MQSKVKKIKCEFQIKQLHILNIQE